MKIKANMLCWLTSCKSYPEWIGRVVTTVRYAPASPLCDRDGMVYEDDAWIVTADWLPPPPFGDNWASPPSGLKPINDPDIDTTERDDALTDNLLDVLQYTKEAA